MGYIWFKFEAVRIVSIHAPMMAGWECYTYFWVDYCVSLPHFTSAKIFSLDVLATFLIPKENVPRLVVFLMKVNPGLFKTRRVLHGTWFF